MGIKGLLHALQPATTVAPISQFKGQRVAIDASGWLHKVNDNSDDSFLVVCFFVRSFLMTFALLCCRYYYINHLYTEFVCRG